MKVLKYFPIILSFFLLAGLAIPVAAFGSSPIAPHEPAAWQSGPAAPVYLGPPGAFGKFYPADGSTVPTNPILRWAGGNGTLAYQYCYDTTPGTTCEGTWTNGSTSSVALTGLSLGTTYYWQVRASNFTGTTYADGGTWWSFTVGNVPGSFYKSTPIYGNGDQPGNTTLSWSASNAASSYEYCYDTTSNSTCDGTWTSAGANTSATLNGLAVNTSYYWQVRAVNPNGSTEADGGYWWYFVVRAAVTTTVTNANDSGSGSLRQAINDAASGDSINFAGDYSIYLASTLTVNMNLVIDGSGRAIAVSGDTGNDGTSNVKIFSIGPQAIVSMSYLYVINGRADGNMDAGSGAGILNQGSLTLAHCTVSSNTALGYPGGAGIFNKAGATLVITDSTISNNTSYRSGGGIDNDGTLTLSRSTISDNLLTGASSSYGGGIQNNGTLTVTNTTISGNTTPDEGGGIYNDYGATLGLANSTISGNTGMMFGGGIYNRGNLTVSYTTFSGNGSQKGAALANDNNSFIGSVTDSNLSGNSTNTAAISNTGTLTISNSTISSNVGSLNGGIYTSGGTLTLTNTTVVGNSATTVGGIWNSGGTIILHNTIVSGNIGPGVAGNCYGTITDGGNNLVWGDTTCPGTHADPLLGSLADNGGPTKTMELLSGSPAIDAANDSNCPFTDQRGVSRPQGLHCDIGAVEAITISGTAGPGGVTLSYTDGGSRTATSAPNGSYSLSVSSGWSGSVTPSLAGYTFLPDHLDYSDVTASLTAQDYTALLFISGFAGVGGATLSGTGGYTTTADDLGNYILYVPYGWTGTLTPSKTGYTFLPPNILFSSAITSNLTGKNFSATLITFAISGNAGLDGVTLSYTDIIPKTATTASDGSYAFSVSYGFSGPVTPSKVGFTFSPSKRTYPSVTSNLTGQNYTPQVTIKGNTEIGGVTLNYTGGSTLSNASGNYTITVAYGWSGTVRPSLIGYAFSPDQRTYPSVTANKINQNYTAAVKLQIFLPLIVR